MSRRLDDDEIDRQLRDLAGWRRDGDALCGSFELPSFRDAVSAIVDVAHVAEEMDHHPDIDLRWRTLHVALSTHSQGGITQLDVEQAHRITEVVQRLGGS